MVSVDSADLRRRILSFEHINMIGNLTRLMVFLLLIALNVVNADQWPPQKWVDVISPASDKCVQETSIDIEMVKDARKGNLPDDDKLKNYLLCVFNHFDLIDKEHHEFEFWKVLTMIPPEMKKPVFELGKGCLQIKGEDYLKACLEFMSCLKKGNPEKFSFMF